MKNSTLSITGKQFKLSFNQSKRTVTIWSNGSKYRSQQMDKQEFAAAQRDWTGNDWQQFLRTNEYSVIK